MVRKLLIFLVFVAAFAEIVFFGFLYFYLHWSQFNKVAVFICANIVVLILIEIGFRLTYRLVMGSEYVFIPKLCFKEIYMEPHPYIPIVYKKHFISQKPMRVDYQLNSDKGFSYGQYISNNFRHLDGPKGNRDIVIPKPASQIRVMCLGASTTGNYIELDDVAYSYPMELEKILRDKFPGIDIIVHNCGHGGWTSAEILVDFAFNLYDAQPDIIIVYHAYNDLPASLTPGFQSDYSHARRNLGEINYLFRIASYIPNFPLKSYNFILNIIFPYMNPRFGVIEAITKGHPDLDGEFKGLQTYGRNIEHIIKICSSSGIDVILSTFAHYLHDRIKDSKHHLKYRQGLMMENEFIVGLAQKYSLPLTDNFNNIPSELKYFVDSIHFTPEGMRLLASNFAEKMTPLIEKRLCSSAAVK